MAAPVSFRYVRSGGMANLRKEASVDTGSLRASDPQTAARLEAAAAAVLAEKAAGPESPHPDGYQHELEITSGSKTTKLSVRDPVRSSAVKELLAVLGPFSKIAQ